MAIRTCTADTSVVSNLPDAPSLSSSQLKAKFDEGATNIKTYINDTMIGDITGTINTAKTELNTTITNNQSANNTRFTTIEGKQSTDETNITSLQGSVATNTSNISSLQSTVAGHTTSINSLNTTVASHTSSINSINTTLGTKANSSDVYTKTQANNTFQTKVTYGTGNPSGGNNGDVYFKYI